MLFVELFQGKTCFDIVEVSIDDMLLAVSNSSLSQEPINVSRVGTIQKSILKKGSLLLPPVLVSCTETGQSYCISGRHRVTSAQNICEHYMLTASGSITEVKTAEQEDNILSNGGERIEPTMGAMYLEVETLREVMELTEAYNGSRSMTQAEKLIMENLLHATPVKELQLALKQRVQEAANITSQTALQLVKHLMNRVPRTRAYVQSEEGQNLLTSFVVEYVNWLRSQPQTELVNGRTVLTMYGNISRFGVKNLEEFAGTTLLEEVLVAHQEAEKAPKQHTNVAAAQQAISDATAASLAAMQARMTELAAENAALRAAAGTPN